MVSQIVTRSGKQLVYLQSGLKDSCGKFETISVYVRAAESVFF